MGSEWAVFSLREVIGDNGYIRGPFGSALRRPELKSSGVPVYEQQHAIAGTRDFRYFIDAEKYGALKRFTVRPDDLIVSCSGTLGRVSMIGPDDPVGIISQALLILRPNRAVVWPKYLYYYMSSERGYEALVGVSTGSVQVNIARRSVIEKTELPLPPLAEQRAIADILGALDDKIELNRRMSETLEEMARALFKAWFVDQVEIPSNADPGDWEVKALDEIADFLNGAACQRFPVVDGEASLPVVKIRELNQGITRQSDRVAMSIPAKWHVVNGDVLFSWSGTLLARIWVGGPAALNQHLFKVTSSTYPEWFFYRWVLHHLDSFRGVAADKATTMGHIKRHHLSDAMCIVPPPKTLRAMSGVMTPLLDRQVACDLESSTLENIRDALLPKLISGELRVPDAERLVSEVA